MSLLRKCCIILAVMFTFEVCIAVGMGTLIAEAEREESRIAYSHSVISMVEQMNSTLVEVGNSFVNAALFQAPFDPSYEASLAEDCEELRRLMKNKWATKQDKSEIIFSLKTAKYMAVEYKHLVDGVMNRVSSLDYYLLLQRFKLEIQPISNLMIKRNKQLLSRQSALRKQRFAIQQARKKIITTLIVTSSTFNVVLVLALMIGFVRHVTNRLAVVQDNFNRFKENRTLNPGITGGDEIETLDSEFHVFARSLREATRKDQAIFNNLPVGLIACSEDGTIERVNPTTQVLFNISSSDLIGKSITSVMKEGSFADLHHATSSTSPGITWFNRGDSAFPAETVLARYDDQGLPKVLLAILDVTDRSEMEQFKQQLLSMVSHDLRTPLTSIHITVDYMEDLLTCGDVATAVPLLAQVKSEAGRLTRLTSDLLDMARIESKRVSCHFSSAGVKQIIETSIHACLAAANDKEIAFTVRPVSEELKVNTDSDRAVQILVNFLSNAVKYSPEDSDVVIEATVENEGLKISVCDQGRGIPPEQINAIFEPFQQVKKEDRKIGTGLGLTICKMLAESLGGSVGVTSVVDHGSTFWLLLPMDIDAREKLLQTAESQDG